MSAAPVPPPPAGPVTCPRDLALALLRDMLRVRRLEEASARLYGERKIRGFLHLYIGEEAVAAGSLRALGPEDNVVATYREHAHALLRGMPMEVLMAEMFGKQEGCSRGRGGSMHLFDAQRRFFGGNAIVAGGLPIAVGLALADRLRGRAALTACFFGEGAVAEGAFHESMNLAALWRLPVLFCCENNRYAMGTAIERSQSQLDLVGKAAAYRVAGTSVDGQDVAAVNEATRAVAARVRETGTPGFIEYRTYRFRPHSMFDPELYRDKAEVEAWKQRGPVHTFTARLKAEGKLTEEAFLEIDREAAREVERAVAFAEAGNGEPAEALLRDVVAGEPPVLVGDRRP